MSLRPFAWFPVPPEGLRARLAALRIGNRRKIWILLGASRLELADRLSPQLQMVRVMDQPIEDRVDEYGVAEVLVPLLSRQVAEHQRRLELMAIFEVLEKLSAIGLSGWSQAPIVEDQQLDLGE